MESKDDTQQPSKDKGCILLMDDEEFVRKIATELLLHLGYSVKTVNEGRELLDLYRKGIENGVRYAAVIMDLTIPGGMGGEETIRELKKLDPDVKAIVSSGYVNDANFNNIKERGFDGMVPKPFNLEELAETLRKVIHQSG